MGQIETATSVRPAAVAGRFYPADAKQLSDLVDSYRRDAKPVRGHAKAIVGPHAGYVYSGPIAGSAYRAFDDVEPSVVRRIILVGPSHRVAFRGVALTRHTHFRTPLGDVPVDQQALHTIEDIEGVLAFEDAHALEHGLEVHVPFLQKRFSDFSLVPLVAGQDSEDIVQRVLERLWGGPETLIVISSDLSHYHDYDTASRMDQATSDAIVGLHDDRVASNGACGAIPVRALLREAKKRGMHADLLDLRSSGDTAGGRDEVVGYGAYAFYEDRE